MTTQPISSQTGTGQTHTLACRMTVEAAAIERICQVVRIRGFRIEQMQVRADGDELEIGMTVSGERSIEMLRSQIEKLHTVHSLQPVVNTAEVRYTA